MLTIWDRRVVIFSSTQRRSNRENFTSILIHLHPFGNWGTWLRVLTYKIGCNIVMGLVGFRTLPWRIFLLGRPSQLNQLHPTIAERSRRDRSHGKEKPGIWFYRQNLGNEFHFTVSNNSRGYITDWWIYSPFVIFMIHCGPLPCTSMI